jgi:tetratricopeptide (TPR) repeat protein
MTDSHMKTTKATVSLQMIVKDERDAVGDIIARAADYFDTIHITVSDKPTANFLKKVANATPSIHIYFREWTDDFAAARNANWEKGQESTYSFWVDADDYFDFSTVPKLVSLAEEHAYDVVYLPYNYAQDEYGNCIARHWRERLVRRSVGFNWQGRVHETLIADVPFASTRVDVEVVHRADHINQSAQRNHKILLRAVQEDPDARYLHYLGLSYFSLKQFDECVEILRKFITVSGWDEEIYRSFIIMSEAAYQLDDMDKATEYAMKAMAMFPHYHQAYWLMAQYENDQDNYKEALVWAEIADQKKLPNSMSIVDPTCVDRNCLIAAQACFMLDRHIDAYKWTLKSNDHNAIDMRDEFKVLAETEAFVTLLPKIRPFFTSDKALYDALPDELKYDKRVRGLRNVAVSPRKWNDKSFVILCGKGYEEWGPHTLDKGMGGSEEAVIYLSREMAKLGYEVTVYGEVEGPQVDLALGPN